MALTDLSRAHAAVWVRCPLPEFDDEEHLLVPYSRETAREVFRDSQAPEWDSRTNTIQHQFDQELFDPNFLKRVWKDWRGIPDPQHPGQRLKGPGLVHADGRVEYPAACTEENKFALVQSRPTDFYLWLQRAAENLAKAISQQQVAAAETFPAADSASAGLSEP